MLERNANVIAWEAVHTMNDLSKYLNFGVPDGSQNCVDDVLDVLSAVVHDIRKGGNSKTWDAASLYLNKEDKSLIQLNGRQHTHQYVRSELDAIYTGGNYDHNFITAATNAVTDDGSNDFTPTNVVYTAGDGKLVITMPNHGLTTSNTITIAEESLTFTCSMDEHASKHLYPRKGDPAYGKSLTITESTISTITVNVGASPIVNYNVSSADYNSVSGDLVMNVGAHTLQPGTSIRFRDGALTFTCDRDDYATEHAYPRISDPVYNTSVNIASVGTTSSTPTGAAYNPSTGIVTLTQNGHGFTGETTASTSDAAYNPNTGIITITSNGHGFAAGDSVKIAGNSLTFTCGFDGDLSNHTYPRSTDPAYNSWLPVLNVTTNTFDVQVLKEIPSSNVTVHSFVSATASNITKANDYVMLDENALSMSCDMGSGAVTKTYPRPQDPAYKAWLPISNVQLNTFDIRILSTIPSTNTNAHTYVSFASNGLKRQTGNITVNVGVAPGEDAAGISVLKLATEMAILTMRNAFGRENLYIFDPEPDPDGNTTPAGGDESLDNVDVESYERNAVKDRFINAADIIERNIRLIAEESIAAALVQYPSLNIPGGNINCVHDLTDFLDSMVWNLRHGGNNKVFHAAEYYVNEGLTHNTEATWITNYARDLALQVMRNESLALNYGRDPAFDTAVPVVSVASTQHTATNASYDAGTGLLTLTVAGHGFSEGNRVNIDDNSLTFTCSMDGNYSNHTYPRLTDQVSQQWLPIISTSTDTFTVNVGVSRIKKFTPTAISYEPNTGNLIMTVGVHDLKVGTNLKIEPNSLTFTCAMDNGATNHTYPRLTDPVHDEPIEIVGITETTVTVNVGTTGITNFDIHDAKFVPNTGVLDINIGAHTFREGESVKLGTSALTFTCAMDSHATDHTYPRASGPGGPDAGYNTSISIDKIGLDTYDITNAGYNAATGVMSVTIPNHGFKGRTTHTPTGVAYTPATGKMIISLANHGFENDDRVKIDQNGLVFTCGMDGHTTNHAYPRNYNSSAPGGEDYAYDKWLHVTNVTQNTFEVNVGSSSNTTDHTFVNSVTNCLTHAGDHVKVCTKSIGFRCSKDSNATIHTYPRQSDPSWDEWLPVTNVAQNTFDIFVGFSGPNDNYTHTFAANTDLTPTNAVYDPNTGKMILTVNDHGMQNGDTIWIEDGAVTFRCGEDSQGSDHAYPRSTVDTFTITAATYDAAAGVMECTVANHGFGDGAMVKFAPGSIKFTCSMDNYDTTHAYPRHDDPVADKWIPVFNTQTNTFQVHVGQSIEKAWTPTVAAYSPTTGVMDLTIGAHSFRAGASLTPSTAAYNPTTGIMRLTIAGHNIAEGEHVKIADNSLTFTCNLDGHSAQKTYPRPSTISHTATAGTTHDPSTGILHINTTSAHNLTNGDWVKFADNSLTFTCGLDGDNSNHTYPRADDPMSGKWVQISNATASEFDVQVLNSIPQSNTSTHVFVSAASNGIQTRDPFSGRWMEVREVGTDWIDVKVLTTAPSTNTDAHTFVSAAANCIQTSGDSVRIAANSITFTCNKDSNATQHTYPRAAMNAAGGADPVYNGAAKIVAVTDTTISVWVGTSANTTSHSFVSAAANAVTSGGTYTHNFASADANGLSQQRDWAHNNYIPVSDVTTNTFSVQLLQKIPSTNNTTHVFQSAASNSIHRGVIQKQNGWITMNVGTSSNTSWHGFKSADSGALISGGYYAHSFVSATTGAIHTGGDYTHEFVSAVTNGITRQNPSGIVTLDIGASGPNDQYTHTFVSAANGALITGGNYAHKFVSATPRALVTGGNYEHTFISAASNSVNVTGGSQLTPTNAAYDPLTGSLTLTVAGHGLQANVNTFTLDNNAIQFSCEFDGNASTHGYPRSTDPAAGTTLTIISHTTDTFTANIGTTPEVNFNVSNATYDAGTGNLVLDIGSNSLQGPTLGLTPTDAAYNPTTGIVTLTINGHGFANGEYIKIADNGLTFTCTQGGGNHSYPRVTDPASGKWLTVSNAQTNTFDVQILDTVPSTNTTTHTLVSIANGCVDKAGESVMVRPNSLTFTCQQDNYSTNHTYPRAKDPSFDRPIPIVGKSGQTITIDVGNSAIVTYTPTNATYDSATGYLALTIGAHGLSTGTTVKLAPNSFTFTCTRDGNTAQKTYPRGGHTFAQKFYADLDFYPYNQGDYVITADTANPKCADVASAITSLMGLYTDAIATPASLTDGTISKTLPNIWPVKYAPDMVMRDVGITFDTNGATSGDWNTTCVGVADKIEGLMDIVIQTISLASGGGGSHLDAVERELPWGFNNNYQLYTCYNVTSATDTLFDVLLSTLGGGSNSDKHCARHILFNYHAITAKAFERTQNNHPTTTADITFAENVVTALMYDLNTGGNQGTLKLVNSWFDGEGNFIAFENVVRQHLLYYVTRVREYVKRGLYDYNNDAQWAGYDLYLEPSNTAAINNRFEYEKESTEFTIDSSINLVYHALNRSQAPSTNKIDYINSTDITNMTNLYNEGEDYNTDPELILLTPTIEVGFERRENTVTVHKPNFFSRGDVLAYVPASQDLDPSLQDQTYYYVLNAEADYFEVTREKRHDARYKQFAFDKSLDGQQRLQTVVRSGISMPALTQPVRDNSQPISAGFNTADYLVGSTSNAAAEVVRTMNNEADIVKLYKKFNIDAATGRFTNGETVQVQGATSNNGVIVQTSVLTGDTTTEGWIYVENMNGTFSDNDVLEGVTSGITNAVNGSPTERMLINTSRGAFNTDEKIFNKGNSAEADIVKYENSAGALVGNSGGRITIDIETIQDDFTDGDVIYGSITDKILDIAYITATGFEELTLNQYVHAESQIECDVNSLIRDGGYAGNFAAGDLVYLLAGTTIKEPGFTAVVTKYQAFDDSVTPNIPHKMWIANLRPYGTNSQLETVTPDPNDLTSGGTAIGKFENLNNFPIILAEMSNITVTDYNSYGRVSGKEITGDTGRIWLEDVVGDFPSNITIKSDAGWYAGVTQSKGLVGRCNRFFRGFDGTQTSFKLTTNNGEAYFPDPAGHLLCFTNGVLQPPGGTQAYTAFSDQIQFTEPPTVGSEFIGYYVGKLRQLDDISFEFDSLRSSFNLRYAGGFYSLTLTEGVSSSTILPENNIIVSLNGVIQEPGLGYELVGSRIIFAEVPRAGSTFVAFSYIGSDADVIAATVVPPIEAGDLLQIDGEGENREVALIESSNSLITFEYTGTVKGRGAEALAEITSGEMTTSIITSPGDGYTSRPNVDVISSSGFDGRVRALMGLLRIDVKTAGVGYAQPEVSIHNTVEDDWTPPTGPAMNGGYDTYAGEGTDSNGDPIVIVDGYITITAQPVNVTVNQGQMAGFTVLGTFNLASDGSVGTTPLNYQWQRKEYGETIWANITGATSSVYTTDSAEQADDGDEFRVAITAAGASPVYSNSVILSVQTGATVISNFVPTQIFQ